MQRRLVNSRLESADQVDAFFDAHGNGLGVKLAERYALQTPDGETPFDYQAHLTHLRGDLATAREELASANSIHVQKLGEVVELRQERDRLTDTEYQRFKIVRHTVEGLYGTEKGFPLAGIQGRTPRGPKALALQMQQTADFFGGRSRSLPGIEVNGFQIDPSVMATDLSGRAAGLRDVLVTINRVRKESQGCCMVKDRAMAQFDQTFLWVARILEGLFNLVGEHELALQVRPSTRRPGRRAVDVGEVKDSETPSETTETQPPADTPATDPSSGS